MNLDENTPKQREQTPSLTATPNISVQQQHWIDSGSLSPPAHKSVSTKFQKRKIDLEIKDIAKAIKRTSPDKKQDHSNKYEELQDQVNNLGFDKVNNPPQQASAKSQVNNGTLSNLVNLDFEDSSPFNRWKEHETPTPSGIEECRLTIMKMWDDSVSGRNYPLRVNPHATNKEISTPNCMSVNTGNNKGNGNGTNTNTGKNSNQVKQETNFSAFLKKNAFLSRTIAGNNNSNNNNNNTPNRNTALNMQNSINNGNATNSTVNTNLLNIADIIGEQTPGTDNYRLTKPKEFIQINNNYNNASNSQTPTASNITTTNSNNNMYLNMNVNMNVVNNPPYFNSGDEAEWSSDVFVNNSFNNPNENSFNKEPNVINNNLSPGDQSYNNIKRAYSGTVQHTQYNVYNPSFQQSVPNPYFYNQGNTNTSVNNDPNGYYYGKAGVAGNMNPMNEYQNYNNSNSNICGTGLHNNRFYQTPNQPTHQSPDQRSQYPQLLSGSSHKLSGFKPNNTYNLHMNSSGSNNQWYYNHNNMNHGQQFIPTFSTGQSSSQINHMNQHPNSTNHKNTKNINFNHWGAVQNRPPVWDHPVNNSLNPNKKNPKQSQIVNWSFNTMTVQDWIKNSNALSRDQTGCRWLQKRIEEQPEIAPKILQNAFQKIIEIITDSFGNYLIQKWFDYMNSEQLLQLMALVQIDIYQICINSYGTRVMQKLIDYLSNENLMKTFLNWIKPVVKSIIININGSHIVLKLIDWNAALPSKIIYQEIYENIVAIAMHKHGCCVLQKCIEKAQTKEKKQLISLLLQNCKEWMTDQCGNYIIQFLITPDNEEINNTICDVLEVDIEGYGKQKYSSNVVEKWFEIGSNNTCLRLLRALHNESIIIVLLFDKFGNYVIQKALQRASEQEQQYILGVIAPHLCKWKNYSFGLKLYSKLIITYSYLSPIILSKNEDYDENTNNSNVNYKGGDSSEEAGI